MQVQTCEPAADRETPGRPRICGPLHRWQRLALCAQYLSPTGNKKFEGNRACVQKLAIRAFIGVAAIAALAATLAAPDWPAAEDYPSRTISLVVAFPAGGGVDTVGRVVAQKLTDALGQQVIVVNRPGAGSVIGTRDVARAQPDGYTLLLLVTGAGLPEKPGYDMAKDFAPIGLIASVPIVIMSNPSVPAKSLAR